MKKIIFLLFLFNSLYCQQTAKSYVRIIIQPYTYLTINYNNAYVYYDRLYNIVTVENIEVEIKNNTSNLTCVRVFTNTNLDYATIKLRLVNIENAQVITYNYKYINSTMNVVASSIKHSCKLIGICEINTENKNIENIEILLNTLIWQLDTGG